jgi:hypothetical protein
MLDLRIYILYGLINCNHNEDHTSPLPKITLIDRLKNIIRSQIVVAVDFFNYIGSFILFKKFIIDFAIIYFINKKIKHNL